MITNYEIEFLPVGNGEKSGDCILFHYFEDGVEKLLFMMAEPKHLVKLWLHILKNIMGQKKLII